MGTSGLASCTARLGGTAIASGAPIDTATDGTRTLTVTAVDGAGNTATATLTVVDPRILTGPYAGASGIEGTIARLYKAVYGRQPDTGGHAYWLDRANNGTGLRTIASFFARSSEFRNTYGTLDDAGFVDLLYTNVLGRPGEPGGVAYWYQRLRDGTPRSTVVLLFSESSEFKTATRTS